VACAFFATRKNHVLDRVNISSFYKYGIITTLQKL